MKDIFSQISYTTLQILLKLFQILGFLRNGIYKLRIKKRSLGLIICQSNYFLFRQNLNIAQISVNFNIEPISFLSNVKRIVTEHHERYDGKGYPNGKKGDELSLEARIIAITYAFDAMTSDRPYRKAMKMEDAVAELRRCAGTQFDPNLVEIFINILKEDPAYRYL